MAVEVLLHKASVLLQEARKAAGEWRTGPLMHNLLFLIDTWARSHVFSEIGWEARIFIARRRRLSGGMVRACGSVFGTSRSRRGRERGLWLWIGGRRVEA